ncbi:MAG TPA: MOSC domain-containing protein, partial [Methylophaga sp.]|nr:MOSC domain-containing protein [Methylophaga sp.]
MIKVGTVKEIWRYPVKGMAGEALQQCRINERGLAGDRLWALRDVLRQEIQSCKFRPELLTCIAKFRDEQQSATGDDVDITFSDGKVMGSDDLAIHQLLSELTGHQSTLEVLRGIEEIDFYRRHKKDSHTWLDELKATFERQEGEPLPDLDNLPQSSQDYV